MYSRRELSLQVDLKHKFDKFSKFRSCAGLVNYRPPKQIDMVSTDEQVKVHNLDKSSSVLEEDDSESTLIEEVASWVNIVYSN